MKYLLALALLVVGGCVAREPSNWEVRCVEPGPEAAACMIECARAANPMSDEEGEDLVAECARRCTTFTCERKPLHYWESGEGWRNCEYAAGPYAGWCASRGYTK